MLVNYADDIIIPVYTELDAELTDLEAAVNAFLAAPSANYAGSGENSFQRSLS